MISELPFTSMGKALLHSFEANADKLAIVLKEGSFSYREMHESAIHISQYVSASKSAYVPVFAYRSFAAYTGIFAVLLSGKAYVPLNPRFPSDKTLSMIQQTDFDFMILAPECIEKFSEICGKMEPVTLICCGEENQYDEIRNRFSHHSYYFPVNGEKDNSIYTPQEVSLTDPAYLLFTSGSTGKPKGVSVSQKNVISYLFNTIEKYQINCHDRISQMFDLTFDLSVHDIFVSALTGASLHVVPEKELFAPSHFIRDHQLTVWFSVPSVIMFMKRMRMLKPDLFPSIRLSLFCGEALPENSVKAWQIAASNSKVYNLYGPTEATIAITSYLWDSVNSPEKSVNGIVPIGKAYTGQEALILNEEGEIAAINEAGELLLSGSQVTNGYYKNAGITREKFITLFGNHSKKWYKTGDLVKKDKDGDICYLDRIDNQVQIRGHRVELQEIDQILRMASGIDLSVSVPVKGGSGLVESIVAYVQAEESAELRRIILEYFKKSLPDYMIPSEILFLDLLPLNSNGKLDRNELVNIYYKGKK